MEKSKIPKSQIGHRYGNWLITGDAQRIGRDLRYPCKCNCGTVRMVSAITLRNGSSTSCGCLIQKDRRTRCGDAELLATPPDVQKIYQLISRGCLPPADQFSLIDGSPAWTLPAIAKIVGIRSSELISHLQAASPRFTANLSDGAESGM